MTKGAPKQIYPFALPSSDDEDEDNKSKIKKEKKKKEPKIPKDEETGLTYNEIVFEAIGSHITDEKPLVSMNTILKYVYLHFTNGDKPDFKNRIKNSVKMLVKSKVLKQKRDSFGFEKKEKSKYVPASLPKRELISRDKTIPESSHCPCDPQ